MANPHPQLIVTVAPDGAVKTNFLHFTGPACLKTGGQFHAFLAELGIETEITRFTPKPELSAAPAAPVVSQAQALPQEGEH